MAKEPLMSVVMVKRGRKMTRREVLVFHSHLYHDAVAVSKLDEL